MDKSKTDQKISEFLGEIDKLEMSEDNRYKLVGKFHTMIDQVLKESNDTDYLKYQSKKIKKNITLATICFLLGLIVAFIPSLFYFDKSKDGKLPAYQFVPNSIGYPKPKYVEMIKTQEQLDLIKKSSIRDAANSATIGAVVVLGGNGLTVWSKKEVSSPDYHLQPIEIQKDKVQNINGYRFTPDTLITRDPLPIEVLNSATLVEIVKKDSNILQRELTEIGAAVHCPKVAKCFVISIANLNGANYTKIEPIKPV